MVKNRSAYLILRYVACYCTFLVFSSLQRNRNELFQTLSKVTKEKQYSNGAKYIFRLQCTWKMAAIVNASKDNGSRRMIYVENQDVHQGHLSLKFLKQSLLVLEIFGQFFFTFFLPELYIMVVNFIFFLI